ncbi:MAG: ABC transporter substrate-binding protein [Trueperaceae bacterium]|nr:ABC transporter substrate-binding protein [Trueperaceae bacterium]
MTILRPFLLALVAALAFGVATAQTPGGTLTAAWSDTPGLDPHTTTAYNSFQVLQQTLDTLVELDANLDPVPALAESWTLSDDGLTWTFELRDDVTFSNGRPLTADDVVYTYERMLDPDVSGNAWRLSEVASIEADGDHTVRFTLNAPNAGFLAKLGSGAPFGIIARESVEDGSIDARGPIGTGPFVITDFQPGTSITLERNDAYWRSDADGTPLPYLDALQLNVIPDESVKRSALVSGDVDWSLSVPLQAIEELEARDDVVIDTTPAPSYHYVGLNTEVEPLDDVRVRRAIAEAIDREQIAEAATFGTGTATQDPIPSTSRWAIDYAPYGGDLDAARALLEEAGVADGFSIDLMATTAYPQDVRAAQVIQAQLAPLGIDVTIDTREFGDWLERQAQGSYDTLILSWLVLLDPDDFFYAQHKSDGSFNVTGYENETLDDLLLRGRGETEFAARYAIYEQVNREIVRDAPFIYLYNPANVQAYRPAVEGYAARADQTIRFVTTWLND